MEINKKYEHLRDWIATLPERFESEGEHVYGGQRNWIKKFTAPDGTVLNVKRYHRPRFINLLVYSFGLRKPKGQRAWEDRKSTRLNSSHANISYAVFCLKKKKIVTLFFCLESV